MKRHFLAALLMSVTLGAFALDNNSEGGAVTIGDRIQSVKELLESIEGYVFIEKGYDKARDLSETFGRTGEVMGRLSADELRNLKWEVYNEDIAGFDTKGYLIGHQYGETIVTVTHGDEIHNFIVFVCPTVTVMSPDGAVYTHQKIYNETLKVDFSQSDNFNINCVMAKYNDGVYDVTDLIDVETGRLASNERITSDLEFTVTLEEDSDDNILSKSPIRLGVSDGKMQLIPASADYELTDAYLANLDIYATAMHRQGNHIVEVPVFSSRGINCINFNAGRYPVLEIPFNDGLYYIKMSDSQGNFYNYKIIIRY